MTIMQNRVINPEKPWLFMEDTIENILTDMEQYTLDPVFEDYGDFVCRNPEWDNPEVAEQYKGLTSIFGNFLTLSHAFRLMTDDEEVIQKISGAVAANKLRPEYLAAKARYMERKAIRRAYESGAIAQ